MKKLLIYTWLPLLLAAFAVTTFTACDDDDDNGGSINRSNLVGKWALTYEEYKETKNGTVIRVEKEEYETPDYILEFKENGEFYTHEFNSYTNTWNSYKDGMWKTEGKSIAIYPFGIEGEDLEFEKDLMTPYKFTATEIIFKGSGVEDGITYHEYLVYKKIE